MTQIIYFSQTLDALVDCLIQQMEQEIVSPFDSRVILVPDTHFKQWLLLEISKRKGISMGLKVFSPQEFLFGAYPNSLEMTTHLYTALSQNKDPELVSYLADKKKRKIELSEHLASLFTKYIQYGLKPEGTSWQEEIFRNLSFSEKNLIFKGPIHCFGIDLLPPLFWDLLFQSEALSLYLFSPCQFFWDDTISEKERKKLKNRNQLEGYLNEAPPLLANWGKIGRETLKVLNQYDLETEEAYVDFEGDTLLKEIQNNLLHFQTERSTLHDDSISVSLTGSSRMREVEVLRDEICKMASKGIPYQEMAVLAPDLEPYIPFIEFVFSECDIPFRIQGVNIGTQSSFFQGLSRLIRLGLGRWDVDDLLSLFEIPSFYRKQGLDGDQIRSFATWISKARIEWGLETQEHPRSWELGLDRFLEDLIFLNPNQQRLEVKSEEFALFLQLFHSLRNDLSPFAGEEQILSFWADRLDHLVKTYLHVDLMEESDATAYSAFQNLLRNLRQVEKKQGGLFPFSLVEKFLSQPCHGQIHGSQLHAVRLAPLEEGSLLPVKALFLMGMDEESFPRIRSSSSLDLMKKGSVPDVSDRDRYLFLRALFSATDYLRISYGHLTADEGKPMAPSPLVQELLNSFDASVTVTHAPLSFDVENLRGYSFSDYRAAKAFYGPKNALSFWPNLAECPPLHLPTGEVTLSISELVLFVKHPWKFYLQKREGMFLQDTWEDTFASQRKQLARGVVNPIGNREVPVPFGLLGEAIQQEADEIGAEWADQLKEWNIEKLSTLQFGESASFSPLELKWDNLTVRLVGDVRNVSQSGLVYLGDDKIGQLLKVWVEALICCYTLPATQVYVVKTGKIKTIENVEAALKAVVELYFRSLSTASPLIPDWADSLLRKEEGDLETDLEDPVSAWVLARTEIPAVKEIYSAWGAVLKENFAQLIELYPTRAKKGASHAEV